MTLSSRGPCLLPVANDCALRSAPLLCVRRQVIVFDPQYDSYACMCRRAGGEVKLVKLNDSDWSVPRDEFRAAFGPRTKMVLVNTPHNPTGEHLLFCRVTRISSAHAHNPDALTRRH